MRQSKVSVRGQTVIPQSIREELGIKPNSKLAWYVSEGVIRIIPIAEDPVAATRGILKGTGFTFHDFIDERNRERQLEREQEEKLMPRRTRGGGRTRAG